MNIATKALGIVLGGLVAIPTIALGSSFTVSLIQGKTPSEAVQVIAEQLDALTGRVDTLEAQQAQTQAEVDALKSQNTDLKAQVDVNAAAGSAVQAADDACTNVQAQIASIETSEKSEKKPVADKYSADSAPLIAQLTEAKQGSCDGSENPTACLNDASQKIKSLQQSISALRSNFENQTQTIEKKYQPQLDAAKANAPEGCLKG